MPPNLLPYPAYKPSSVEWLGEVPAHWDVRRLRNIVNPDSAKTGYEVSFTCYFYQPRTLRALQEIWVDIRALEQGREGLLDELVAYTTERS